MRSRPFVSRKNGVSRIVRDSYSTKSSTGLKTDSWWAINKKVRERDRDCCTSCGAPCKGTGDVHHIVPLSRGGTTSMSNLILLCEPCHKNRHSHLRR